MGEAMIRQATLQDLDDLDDLAVRTITHMHQHGRTQWTLNYPRKVHFKHDIDHGDLFVYVVDARIAGVYALCEDNEPSYQTIDWTVNQALVMHRIMVDPVMQGKRLVDHIFLHAYHQAAKRGYDGIKIDTHQNNQPMLNLLKRHGFNYRGYLKAIDRLAFERAC